MGSAWINRSIGKKYFREIYLADFKWRFVLRFHEKFDLEVNIDRNRVIKLLFFFVFPA